MSVSEPAINTTVTLELPGRSEPLVTRVEELDDTVVVADPLLGREGHPPSLGTTVLLTWQGDRGPTEMPAELVAIELRTLSLWRLRPTDGPRSTQRRDHVRIGTLLPLVLASDTASVAGHLVDLSEGGLRSVCPAPAPVAVGDHFDVHFDVDDRRVTVRGLAVRVDSRDDHVCIGCRFVDAPPQLADTIRKFVFDRQARERRLRNGR